MTSWLYRKKPQLVFSFQPFGSSKALKYGSFMLHINVVFNPHFLYSLQAFQGLTLRPGEILCVELSARDRDCGRLQGLLFLGCVRQEALGMAHRNRGTPGPHGCHFVGLRGPRGKGHAQVALRRGPPPAQVPHVFFWLQTDEHSRTSKLFFLKFLLMEVCTQH